MVRTGGRARVALFVALMMGAIAPPAAAFQTDDTACSVRGEVIDQRGLPIKGARIEIVGTSTAAAAGDRGEFCVRGSLPATFQVLVTADAFNPQLSDPLKNSAPVQLTVRLFALLSEYVVVDGRSDRLDGIAQTASEGTINASELSARPVLRSADLLEAVPGVVMTQHSTGGHAPIILLRGYNLDHGTDFATFLEGVPLSLPSHAHAQGYTDLNFLIPELIDRMNFSKGPYAASIGDFGTAGAATIEMRRALTRPTGLVEFGSFSQMRAMSAGSRSLAAGSLLGAFDVSHTDGPSTRPDDFSRLRGMARFSRGDRSNGWTASAFAYKASWFGSDGYPSRAAARGDIPRYGSLDQSDGGKTFRFLGSIERRWSQPASLSTLSVFGQAYSMDLYSNLTFETFDPIRGDQIHQRDRRGGAGAAFAQSRSLTMAGRPGEFRFGVQSRYDAVGNALFNTVARVPAAKISDSGATLPDRMYDVAIHQASISPHAELQLSLASRARVTVGARADGFAFHATDETAPRRSPRRQAVLSPKAGLVLGPWRATELYVNAGRGFHSNHAAGVVLNDATPVVRTFGTELGLRTAVVRGLQSSVSLWRIDSDSELVYVPEAGFTEPSRPGRRYGVEWLNFWRPRPWLAFDLDVSFSEARYTTDPDGTGRHIPDAIAGVYSAGVAVEDRRGWSGAVRGRYLGPRALSEDGRVNSRSSFVVNAQLGKTIGRWQIVGEAFNLANRRYDDITYFYETRLRDRRTGTLEEQPIPDFVTHPAEPRSVRVKLGVRF